MNLQDLIEPASDAKQPDDQPIDDGLIGAKFVPVKTFRDHLKTLAAVGLTIGAIAGAGYAIMRAR